MTKSTRPRLNLSQALTTAEDGRPLLPTRQQMIAAAATPPATPQTPPAPATEMGEPTVAPVQPLDLEALASAVASRIGTSRQEGHKLSKFSSLAEFAMAAYKGDPDALTAFALTDQITTNNAGVIQPGWLTDVKGIIDRGARAITAFGGAASLPDSGMDVNWPYYDGTLSSLVGVQATQKTEVTSARVDIKKGTSNLVTYAGGSDISWQLLQRSDPSYLSAYLRILSAAYAVVTDAAFVGTPAGGTGIIGMAKASTNEIVLDLVLAGTTADAIRAAVFEASTLVDDATGSPASVLLAATDVFKALGAKTGLVPNQYGTSNVSGTADAASLRVEVNGLPVVRVPSLPNGYMVAGNDMAAKWHGTGPLFASADEVSKLGTDQVVWGMGAAAVYIPKGLCRIVKVATA